jgi:integrase
MPKLDKKLTDAVVRSLPLPEAGEVIHWCGESEGFGLRVSATGVKAFVMQRRVNGKDTRRTVGKATGTGAISCDTARSERDAVSGELTKGVDRLEVKRVERKAEKETGVTLAVALAEYVKGKRRDKGDAVALPLKERTKLDYMAMVKAGRTRNDGKPYANGPLYELADIPLVKITAANIKKVYDDAVAKSTRQAVYAMQVLRAVLNWHGVQVPDSPLAKGTAGKVRIVLAKTTGDPTPIPKDRLGAWWTAATAMAGNEGADGCRFILLTGCRPGEVFGSSKYTGVKGDKPIVIAVGLRVRDIDLDNARLRLIDTKNRTDHTVHLSTQALEILSVHCKGKKPDAKVFDVQDPGKTLDAINAAAGVTGITPHKLRHTFASIAAKKCSVFELKAMLNHAATGDVTADHYVDVDDDDLAAAWQRVADFIVKAE